MREERQLLTAECPTAEIAAYIDGELDAEREGAIGQHFDHCADCTRELNQQKLFLCGLNYSLSGDSDIELPPNFTKSLIVNAESSVSGVRRPAELYNAIFICAGLLLFALFVTGSEADRLVQGVASVLERIAIVGGFFGHLLYAVFIGLAIIVRSFASQIPAELTLTAALAFAVVIMVLMVTRKLLPIRRV